MRVTIRAIPTRIITEFGGHLQHLRMVVKVQSSNSNLNGYDSSSIHPVHPIDAKGTQCQVTTRGSERMCHPNAQDRTGTSDENFLVSNPGWHIDYLSSGDMRQSANTLPPVWNVEQY